jgi:hypothetical protein
VRIMNKTEWHTENLRKILQRVAEKELDPEQIKALHVTIVTVHRRGQQWISGYAWPHSNSMVIKLPSKGPIDSVELAHVAAHEMAHTHGMLHSDMKGCRRYAWVKGWEELYAWAAEFPVEKRAARPKPSLDQKRQVRLEQAQKALARWQRKAKLAATKIRKYKTAVKRVEKTLTVVASPAYSEIKEAR